ncbi:MAG: hypothetical protein ACLSWV_01225 [Pygmaiobacter massiliensis]
MKPMITARQIAGMEESIDYRVFRDAHKTFTEEQVKRNRSLP